MIGLPGGMLGAAQVNITITVTGRLSRMAGSRKLSKQRAAGASARAHSTRDLFGSPRKRNRTTNDCEIAAVKKRDTGECLSRSTRRRLHNVLFRMNIASVYEFTTGRTPESSSVTGLLVCFAIGIDLRVNCKYTRGKLFQNKYISLANVINLQMCRNNVKIVMYPNTVASSGKLSDKIFIQSLVISVFLTQRVNSLFFRKQL